MLSSDGYVLAKLTEQEERRASLGVPQIFLANDEDRFSTYFCNKYSREYTGCPQIGYENPKENISAKCVIT